ncbi:branched-chain amino acid ABC transporter permease [Tianweitania sediminis]|jgi:branched-chain amino acid transport system permease protein|uniref:Branched-chain amino acid ABC transporter permease n=1 Tax=Tianweitania sediminis TaxID=1502156 RepID=A0A8J7UMH9_9HYPH|nr:branched-chain amino acid ABC transporter permease [Tianweitania sediminis]MBP0440377.1 branched-chain amino acid ABC transporter permease [Tianweitania sediminis]
MTMTPASNPFLGTAAIIVVGIVCLLAPSLNLTTIDFLIGFAVYAALAVSWNWVCGLGGLINMAHIAFYAIGAYSCAIAVAKLGLHPIVGIVAGVVITASLAGIVSYLSFRLQVSELYFALLTLMLADGIGALSRGFENEYSLGGVYLPFVNDPLRFAFLDKVYYYYALIALVIALLLLQHWVTRSKWGLLIAAAKDSERAASSLGVPVVRILTSVAVASAIPPAIVGSIFALSSLYVTADNVFLFELLLATVIATVIGGLGTLWGPFLGALAITLIHELIRSGVGVTDVVGLTDMVYGAILVCIVVLFPGGLIGAFRFVRDLFSPKPRNAVLDEKHSDA